MWGGGGGGEGGVEVRVGGISIMEDRVSLLNRHIIIIIICHW